MCIDCASPHKDFVATVSTFTRIEQVYAQRYCTGCARWYEGYSTLCSACIALQSACTHESLCIISRLCTFAGLSVLGLVIEEAKHHAHHSGIVLMHTAQQTGGNVRIQHDGVRHWECQWRVENCQWSILLPFSTLHSASSPPCTALFGRAHARHQNTGGGPVPRRIRLTIGDCSPSSRKENTQP